MKKGVPSGFRHKWSYLKSLWNEKKVRPGLWKFNWKATKRKRSRKWGNFGKGTKGAWKINAIQYIVKTGKGKYQTKMIGTKKPLKFYVKKPKNKKRKYSRKYRRSY